MTPLPDTPPLPQGRFNNEHRGEWTEVDQDRTAVLQKHMAAKRAAWAKEDRATVLSLLIVGTVAFAILVAGAVVLPWLLSRGDLPDCPSGHHLGEQCLPVGITSEEVDQLISAQRDEAEIDGVLYGAAGKTQP